MSISPIKQLSLCLFSAILISFVVSPVEAKQAKQETKQEQKKDSKKSDDKKADGKESKAEKKVSNVPTALDFTMKNIDGEDVELSKYKGKVVLFVNVASKCGYTKQYKQLQELHEEYAGQGLAIVGVPCNQFGGQEPGTEAEIMKFCNDQYGVEFDMMAKVDVKDKDQCELYEHLTGLDLEPKKKGDVRWNFEKFILDRKGQPIARFATKVSPDSDEFVEVIETALAEKLHYTHTSEKLGRTYYLFSKEVPLKNSDKTSTIYFFSKDANNAKGTPLAEVPEDREVSETKTGMLVLKKKAKKAVKKK